MDLSGYTRGQLEHDLRALRHAHDLYKLAHPAQRRDTDGPNEDYTSRRAPSTSGNGGNGFEIGYKGAGVQARGPLGILAGVFVLMIGVVGWVGYSTSERIQGLLVKANEGHSEIAASQDRMACIVSLSPEEKTRLRLTATRESFVDFCRWLRFP